MRKLLALFILLVLSVAALAWGSTNSANEKTAIATVTQNYMDAYYTADAARMQKTLHPDFHKRTLQTVNGHTEISEDTIQSMVEGGRLGSGKEIPVAKRVQKIEVLDVYRDAVSVKVVTGRWIDYMHLSKMNGEMARSGCGAAIHAQVSCHQDHFLAQERSLLPGRVCLGGTTPNFPQLLPPASPKKRFPHSPDGLNLA